MPKIWNALLVTALMATAAPAKEVISTKIPPDTKIDPLVIIADSNLGACERPEPGKKDRRVPGSAQYEHCMTFPTVLAEQLKERGFDVQLEYFNPPGPISQSDYFDQERIWRAEVDRKHADRYALFYGGMIENREGAILLLRASSPGEKRESLGFIQLDQSAWSTVNRMKYATVTTRKPLADVTAIIANTLEKRCPTMGFLKSCPDRVPLTELEKK
jgi:hypothetical protein